jgi:short-subunit dehydrogenase
MKSIDMKHVIITGGTRGIGSGLVNEFLRHGYRVTFSGTTDISVNNAVEYLLQEHDSSQFRGIVCDVTRNNDLSTLWDFSNRIFGPVDIWINNAGISNRHVPFNKLERDEIRKIIEVNITGLMEATHVAFEGMSNQGYGAIYNMGGLGSDGRMIKGLTPYGMSKKAVQYFTKAFAREVEGSNVIVGLILPGMVFTDLLMDPIRKDPTGSRRATRVFNLMAEEVETVAPFIVDRIIENNKNGTTISYLNTIKILRNLFTRPFSSENLVRKYL